MRKRICSGFEVIGLGVNVFFRDKNIDGEVGGCIS